MHFRDISFDMIVCTLTEIFHAHLQLISIFAVSMLQVISVCHSCESLSQNLELVILNHTEYLSNH